jgi:hypothetical protein
MRTLRLSLVAALLLAVLATPALARRPTALFDAVSKVYAPKKVHVNEFCYKTFHGHLYALVAVVYRRSGKASASAYRFINKSGWAGMWNDGKVLRVIPKHERGHVRAVVKRLHRECA